MLKPLPPNHAWTVREAAHLLNRAGFGGSPDAIKGIHKLGPDKAVAQLLTFGNEDASFPVPAWMEGDRDLKTRQRCFEGRRKLQRIEDPKERLRARQKLQRAYRSEQREQTQEMVGHWMKRMLETEHPLREKMTLFWHGHFATSLQKVKVPALMFRQNALFREHAIGDFRKLTEAICQDPAMMLYLDTNQNRKGKPNENFARELLELFTLGEGQYDEQDIKEAARAFTGYSIDRRKGEATFQRRRHDGGEKTVLGKTGAFKGEDIVGIALEQDACARFITTKLWEFFVAENPDKETLDDLAGIFRKNSYRVSPVLKAIFTSEAFYADPVIRNQIKSPVQFLVQLARQLEMNKVPLNIAATTLSSLGQTLYHPPNVAGWEGGKSWINTNTLLSRYNLAGLLVKGARDPDHARSVMKGADRRMMSRKNPKTLRNFRGPDLAALAPPELRKDSSALVEKLIFRLFQDELPRDHRKSFDEYAESKQERQFTDVEVAELLHLMMSTPTIN